MMLMQGVIDSPDIPLNVSRSYLQSDTAVKKISGYITKKVASRLEDLFKADRADFEKKWDDIRLFIIYGMLTDEKFCDAAMKFLLLKDTEGRYFTLEEYKTLVEAEQTDKDGTVVYLYATDPVAQYNYIKAATDKGYNVLLLDGQLDNHFVQLLERKLEKTRIVRVDSDVVENLIRKDSKKEADLSPLDRNILTTLFSSQIPAVEKTEFIVSFEAMAPDAAPIVITQNEYMRRMKDLATMQPGMSFYGEMPDSYMLVVNTEHPLVKTVRDDADKALASAVKPLMDKVDADNASIEAIRKGAKDGKLSAEEDKQVADLEKAVSEARAAQEKDIKAYAAGQDLVKQLIDLALLGNGLLKGETLSHFISRSITLLNK